MQRFVVRRLAVAVVCSFAGVVQAQPMRLEDCLRIAGERAPEVIHARGDAAEIRARRGSAARRLVDNPELALSVGPRWAPGGTTTDVEVGVSQAFALGGRRGARVAMIDADAARADAEVDEARRSVQREAGLTFVTVVAARERGELLGRMV